MLTGLAIVFIWKRENSKPPFIKVIWVLLCLAEIAVIVYWVLDARLTKFQVALDHLAYESLYPYYVATLTVLSALVSLAHWIFATQYLEVMLLMPILLEHGQADIKKKQQRIRWIMYAANSYYLV